MAEELTNEDWPPHHSPKGYEPQPGDQDGSNFEWIEKESPDWVAGSESFLGYKDARYNDKYMLFFFHGDTLDTLKFIDYRFWTSKTPRNDNPDVDEGNSQHHRKTEDRLPLHVGSDESSGRLLWSHKIETEYEIRRHVLDRDITKFLPTKFDNIISFFRDNQELIELFDPVDGYLFDEGYDEPYAFRDSSSHWYLG